MQQISSEVWPRCGTCTWQTTAPACTATDLHDVLQCRQLLPVHPVDAAHRAGVNGSLLVVFGVDPARRWQAGWQRVVGRVAESGKQGGRQGGREWQAGW